MSYAHLWEQKVWCVGSPAAGTEFLASRSQNYCKSQETNLSKGKRILVLHTLL